MGSRGRRGNVQTLRGFAANKCTWSLVGSGQLVVEAATAFCYDRVHICWDHSLVTERV